MSKIILISVISILFSCEERKFDDINKYNGCVIIGSRVSASCAKTDIIKIIRTRSGKIISIVLPIEYEDVFMKGDTIK